MLRFLIALFIFICFQLRGQTSFPPPDHPILIVAHRTTGKIIVDGKLTESSWQTIPSTTGFKQVEPQQGEPASFDTEVKITFDDERFYVGFFCHDTIGIKGLNVPNLQRDFDIHNNDLFGLAIDPLNTKRNAVAFQVTPYGNMRDLQVFDDTIFDLDWDALWETKTNVTDEGWGGEIAIPFSSFRYPAATGDSISWGINFIRVQRRLNQISAFPGFPRSLDTYRMTYIASLRGIRTPEPKSNLRVNPYTLIQANQAKDSAPEKNSFGVKVGGDVKWAATQHSLVDVTINTDFAQADVDRQVVNLTRFSIQFPERRQFFLENSGLFSVGDGQNIEPFFSRNIGLDSKGNAIPILAGAKYTDRTTKRSIGAMYVLQDGDDTSYTHFSAARLIRNYGSSNNMGLLLTNKFVSGNSHNTVAALNGIHRVGEKWTLRYLYSNSFDQNQKSTIGTGSFINVQFNSNQLYFTSNHALISKEYTPGIGFLSRGNLITHNTGLIFILRPQWRPHYARSFQPGVFFNLSQRESDFQVQEAALSLFPFYLYFSNGALLSFRYQYNWQILTDDFPLLSTSISKGNYFYQRSRLKYNTDLSKKISFAVTGETGSYFDGDLYSVSGELKLAPVPHISFSTSYELNELKNLSEQKAHLTTHLITTSLRLAFNPNLQLISFLQHNSTNQTTRTNIRFTWQYKPLSFIYFVFNSDHNQITKTQESNAIFKINFLKQF